MTWPPVFDGIGALVVNCALDPAQLVEKIERHAQGKLSWIAYKVGGTDVADDTETRHCIAVWRGMGLETGPWVYCLGPPDADAHLLNGCVSKFGPFDFGIYDVEREYKADEGGHYEWARELTIADPRPSRAVTSYGGYKTSIDFGSFAHAGWPILAQCYDSFAPGDQVTYAKPHGPYPPEGVHAVLRALSVSAGESVYRPEGIDG